MIILTTFLNLFPTACLFWGIIYLSGDRQAYTVVIFFVGFDVFSARLDKQLWNVFQLKATGGSADVSNCMAFCSI